MSRDSDLPTVYRSMPATLAAGSLIETLGRLTGLGRAEFRLPILIGLFRFAALEAVILNKAASLVVVASALPFRAETVPLGLIAAHWPVVLNLLVGSLLGAWVGSRVGDPTEIRNPLQGSRSSWLPSRGCCCSATTRAQASPCWLGRRTSS